MRQRALQICAVGNQAHLFLVVTIETELKIRGADQPAIGTLNTAMPPLTCCTKQCYNDLRLSARSVVFDLRG
ncbi:hypothetical protein CK507_15680 [Pseudomonas sp. WN033]|nr:hypothetical protein CK507_15680 [Pseudomonas sp. WN033]